MNTAPDLPASMRALSSDAPAARPGDAPAASTHQLGVQRPRRVLVVDDEHLAAESLKRSLRILGFEPVGPARDGAHSIQMAFYTQPDLVLMDIRMATDRDGIDAAASLYSQLAIPVIIVSAYSGSKETGAASQAGVFGFLVKPATTEQLGAAIDVAWARYQQVLSVQAHSAELVRRLEERRTIERAKWLLVEREGLTEGQAMDALRARSQQQHRPLHEVASDELGR
jgi:response regulator NasT